MSSPERYEKSGCAGQVWPKYLTKVIRVFSANRYGSNGPLCGIIVCALQGTHNNFAYRTLIFIFAITTTKAI